MLPRFGKSLSINFWIKTPNIFEDFIYLLLHTLSKLLFSSNRDRCLSKRKKLSAEAAADSSAPYQLNSLCLIWKPPYGRSIMSWIVLSKKFPDWFYLKTLFLDNLNFCRSWKSRHLNTKKLTPKESMERNEKVKTGQIQIRYIKAKNFKYLCLALAHQVP